MRIFRLIPVGGTVPFALLGCATARVCGPEYEVARSEAAAQAALVAHVLADAAIFFLHVFAHCH